MISLLDFHNFISASTSICQLINPYGQVQFFAPPWAALFLYIFVLVGPPYNALIWQVGSVYAVILGCVRAFPKNYIYPLISLISLPTLLLLLVGQISAFVSLACIGLLFETSNKRRLGLLLICLYFASFKPSIAFVPILVCMIVLARKKDYLKLLTIAAVFAALSISFELLIPGVTAAWLKAMFSGKYTLGASLPITLSFSNGISLPLGRSYYFGTSLLISVPLGLWFIYLYIREGLSARVIAASLCIGFLFLPYYRMHDLVMLYFPIGYLLRAILYKEKTPQLEASLQSAFSTP